jgi:hypothetical protein
MLSHFFHVITVSCLYTCFWCLESTRNDLHTSLLQLPFIFPAKKLIEKLKLSCMSFQSMFVFFHPVKFGLTFTLGNLMALGRSVSLLVKIPVYTCALFYNLLVLL